MSIKNSTGKTYAQYLASFIANEMTRACKRRNLTVTTCGIPPHRLAELVKLNYDGHIDRKTAKQSLEFMLDREDVVRELLDYIVEKFVEQKKNDG